MGFEAKSWNALVADENIARVTTRATRRSVVVIAVDVRPPEEERVEVVVVLTFFMLFL